MVVPRAGPGAVGIGPIHFQAGRDTGRPDMALDFLCFFMWWYISVCDGVCLLLLC